MEWNSIIQGAFDIAAQQIQIAHDKEMQRRSYTFNEMAADNADTRTRKLYNDFETPSAKKRMLEEAGFNPALVYGGMNGNIPQGAQGAGGSAGASNLGGITAPNMMHIFEILNSKKDLEVKESQKENIEADTRNKNADTEKKGVEVNKIKSEIELMRKQGKLTDAQVDKINKEIDLMDNQIDEVVSRINLNRKNEDKIDAEIAKTNFETNFLLPSIKALNDFNAGATEVEVWGQKYNKQEIDLLMHNTYLQLYHFVASMLGIEDPSDIKNARDQVWGMLTEIWNKIFGDEKDEEGGVKKAVKKVAKETIERNKYGKDPFSWQEK